MGIGGVVSSAHAAPNAAAARAKPIKVAIVPSIAVNVDSARVDALGQELAEALASELDVEALGGLEVRRRLPAEGLPADCLTTPACVADVAKRLDADQLLFVVVVDASGTGAVQLDSTWVEPASGKSTSRPAIDVPSINDAKSRFASAARQLLPDAPVRDKPQPNAGGLTAIGGTMTPEVPRHVTTPAMITGGIAIVGLGVGIGFGLKARSEYIACDSPGACDKDQRDAIRTKTILADTGFAIAIGGIVATTVLYMTSGKESRLVVEPAPGGGVSLAAIGRF